MGFDLWAYSMSGTVPVAMTCASLFLDSPGLTKKRRPGIMKSALLIDDRSARNVTEGDTL